jgi:hypothetical protein
MRNSLYSRLKPEVVLALQNEATIFPNITNKIVDELNEKYWMGDLTLDTVLSLASIDEIREVAGVRRYSDFPFTSVMSNLLTEVSPLGGWVTASEK